MFLLSAVIFLCIQRSSHGGISRTGNPLSWKVAKPVLNSVRLGGIRQFICHYNRAKEIQTPLFLWGDEIEYGLFGYDEGTRRFDLSLRGKQIREQLSGLEEGLKDQRSGCEWQPEYGSWMIEAVPRDPYGGYISDLLLVERNMQLRRKRLHAVLRSNEIAPTSANFPMLGVEGYPHTEGRGGAVAASLYVSDRIINPHPRFGTLTKNIRQRRQENVDIVIPRAVNNIERLSGAPREDVRFDCCDGEGGDGAETLKMRREGRGVSSDFEGMADGRRGQMEGQGEVEREGTVLEREREGVDTIHMDAMAFGMGCCCLQVTMQANDDRESRFLHDQLALLAPLFLALSASTPVFKGKLAGTDTRWDVISQSVDDRTAAERGVGGERDEELVSGGSKLLFKSRYSSVSRFIGKTESDEEQAALDSLNDMDANVDEEALQILLEGGLDPSLAAHVAHLFVRDPLVIFDDAVVLDDQTAMDHFENIQSTNWRTMRWKSPSLEMGLEAQRRAAEREKEGIEGEEEEKDIQTFGPGWRVEFRPLEIQLTDFENAAFSLLTVLTTRSLLAMGYNFYLPVSKMEENMERAQREDAVMSQRFWVRKEAFSPSLITVPLPAPIPPLPLPVSRKPSTPSPVNEFGTIRRTLDSGGSLVPKGGEITAIELTLDEFFNGRTGTAIDRAAGRQGEGFPGLIPAIYGYLEALGCDALMIGRLRPYLTLLQKRASGELPTAAQWIRRFVRTHPEYKGDGALTPGIADELLMLLDDVGMGRVQRPDLLGDVLIEPLCPERVRESVKEPSLLSSVSSSPSPPSSSSSFPVTASLTSPSAQIDGSYSTAVRVVERKAPCKAYTPISVCSRNVVSCFRGGDSEGEDLESAVQVPWIAHVLMGSGAEPDTYLDINLIQ